MRFPVRLALALLTSLLMAAMVVWAPSARADEDTVRDLRVTYAIQPDGSVDVRYEMDRRLERKGLHGITFGIPTREPWDQDLTKDAVYKISDIRVSSPSGAPATFTERPQGAGSRTEIKLRIGDPDVELDTRDVSYVIEYTVEGAMRTFDGAPEFHWDVTSNDFPKVERFSATVTGPSGVERARCLAGREECQSSVTADGATYSADKVSGVLTVVAALPAGSVRNSEPILEPKRLISSELREVTGTAEVQPDGSAKVEQRLLIALPQDHEESDFDIDNYARVPWSDSLDQELTLRDLEVTDGSGNPLEWRVRPTNQRQATRSVQSADLHIDGLRGTGPEPTQEVLLTYVLEGAVGVEGDTARLRMPIQPAALHEATAAEMTWVLPEEPSAVGCVHFRYNGGLIPRCEFPDAKVAGNTITADLEALRWASSYKLTDFAFPASALTSSHPLAESIDAARIERERWAMAGGAGAGAGVLALGLGAARIGRRRDERFADVAPGLTDPGGAIRPTRSHENIPVRFNPPDVHVYEAGVLLDRGFKATQLAATLVSLAVRGAVKLGSKPLKVQRDDLSVDMTSAESRVARLATDGDHELSDSKARRMREHMVKTAKMTVHNTGWFHTSTKTGWRVFAVVAVAFLPVIVHFVLFVRYGSYLREATLPLLIGLFIGGCLAFQLGLMLLPKPTLTANGTAKLDQVKGFKQYIATAEAEQLDFEADRDIFRRYLPWAVLFGLTDRWTKVCAQLAAAGKIDPIDTSFWAGANFNDFGREIASFSSDMRSASSPPSTSSSGGSGGSSGFSSGGGGSGGGGASSSSW